MAVTYRVIQGEVKIEHRRYIFWYGGVSERQNESVVTALAGIAQLGGHSRVH